jgi:mxaJ protein
MRASATCAAVVTCWAGLAVAGGLGAGPARASAAPPLRICADPNNLPFSNDRLQGFENRLALLVARELGRTTDFVWWPQRRGFVRMTLNAGSCDVIMGVPTSFELAQTTRPYYRSAYGFLTRAGVSPPIASFDDERLRRMRIGVQMIGDDFANSPPAHALSARGMIRNVIGYSVLGNYREANPPARIVEAVANRVVDVAVVWGPLAGYFAAKSAVRLHWTAVAVEIDPPFLPFAFDIAMAVRRGDEELLAQLDAVVVRRQEEIDRLLDSYRVPRTGVAGRPR